MWQAIVQLKRPAPNGIVRFRLTRRIALLLGIRDDSPHKYFHLVSGGGERAVIRVINEDKCGDTIPEPTWCGEIDREDTEYPSIVCLIRSIALLQLDHFTQEEIIDGLQSSVEPYAPYHNDTYYHRDIAELAKTRYERMGMVCSIINTIVNENGKCLDAFVLRVGGFDDSNVAKAT